MDLPKGDAAGPFKREAVDSGADGGERDGLQLVVSGNPQGGAVTGGEQLVFIPASAMPDRSNTVDHMLCGQAEARSNLCIAGGTTVQRPAGFQQFRSRRPMDRSVHPAAAKQGAVGRIHYRIHLQGRDIALDYPDHPAYDAAPGKETFQMETVRAFIAVDIGEEIRGRLDELQRNLKKVHAPVRWVHPRSMHLTLVFLGSVPAEQIDSIRQALDRAAAQHPAFDIEALGTGTFGRPGRPRVVWAGIAECPLLAALRQHIAEELKRISIAFDDKSFSPHLTLGRVKGFDRHIPPLLEKLGRLREAALGSAHIDRVELIESILKPHGAEYRVLHRVPLSRTSTCSSPSGRPETT